MNGLSNKIPIAWQPEERRRPRFDPTVNLGHILTAASMVGSTVVMVAVFYARLAVLETTQAQLTRAVDRLTVLVDELRKPAKP